jgi:RimJ/RimL family protein N-acetyltransferase
MNSHRHFETERLLLRPTNQDDAAFILNLFNSPKWLRFIGDRHVRSIGQAESYIAQKIRPQFDRLGYGNYIVIHKLDGTKLGSCGLYDRPGLVGIDLGFAFLPEFEGKGFAFEAANRLKQAAAEDFSLTHLSAITMPDNLSSQKLLVKLGFQFQSSFYLPDDSEELWLYELKFL